MVFPHRLQTMSAQPAFRLLGFPVHVRAGFLYFLVLVVFVNGVEYGTWLAGFMAVLTLLHELGHALAARATGAKAEISLDFFYGYASFVPTRKLSRLERAGISFAGPAVQIGVGVIGLLLLGVNPASIDDVNTSPATFALWWAGPMIGLFNLLPVLPFDGGNILLAGVEGVLKQRARVVMLYFSIALTIALAAFCFASPRLRGLGIFVVLPLLSQVSMVAEHRSASKPKTSTANYFARAEAAAWATGDVTRFVAGQLPSPWFRAKQQLDNGDTDVARQLLVSDFSEAGEPNWWPPDAASERDLERLLALLPHPLPTGRTYSEFALASVLLRLGEFDTAARYAAECYHRHPAPMLALCVSRAAAALRDRDVALGWLRTAVGSAPASEGLRHAVQRADEFDHLRYDAEFQAITAEV
jgi:Zn-dependent protease